MSFTASEINEGYIEDGEDVPYGLDDYAYDTEKKFLYMSLKKLSYPEGGTLLDWDEMVVEVKKIYTIEAGKESYKYMELEEIQEELTYMGIPFEKTDTKETLIDKIIKVQLFLKTYKKLHIMRWHCCKV